MLAAIATLATAARVSAEARPRYRGSIEGTLLGAPVTLDPALAQTHAEVVCAELLFDTLYDLGPDGAVRPRLATALPEIVEGKARIPLREGVLFADGTPVLPADVAASIERLRGGPSRWISASISSVRVDGSTIELALKAATPELATLLALPQAAITKGGKPPGGATRPDDRVVGTGPFVVDSFEGRSRRILLRANEMHFAGRPYVDSLVLRWYDTADAEARQFEKGDAQLSARGPAAFAGAQPKYRAADLEGPAAVLVYVGFGRTHMDVTSERAFRRALDRALSRGAMSSIGAGERVIPSRMPVPVEAGGAALPAWSRAGDLDAARRSLADAATRVKALDATRVGSLVLEILVEDTRPDDREIAERVALALTKLGIKSSITAVPAATMRDRVRRGDCDLWIGQLAAPVTSSLAWWGVSFAAGGDSWAEQQLTAGTIALGPATAAFEDRLPILPLAFRAVRLWHRSDLRGLRFDAAARPHLDDMFLFGEPVRTKAKP